MTPPKPHPDAPSPAEWCYIHGRSVNYCPFPGHATTPPEPQPMPEQALARKLGFAEPFNGGARWVYDGEAMPAIAEALQEAHRQGSEAERLKWQRTHRSAVEANMMLAEKLEAAEERVRTATAERDREWINRLGLTSTSMEAALNSLHNIEVDREERVRTAAYSRDEEWSNAIWPENPEGGEPIDPEQAKEHIALLFRTAADSARREAVEAIRAACSACNGDGYAEGGESECEYCGRPMDAIRALSDHPKAQP